MSPRRTRLAKTRQFDFPIFATGHWEDNFPGAIYMKSITREEWAKLILMLAILLGGVVRFLPTLVAGFPINDGGMFAAMVDDLKASGYALPVYTSFNLTNIPYAYPPLGFYLARIAGDLFHLDSVTLARWLPAFFATLAIPAFYLLAVRLMPTRLHAAFSTLFFALMPRAFSWFVEGGGLTRSPAQVFMLLTFASVVTLYQKQEKRQIIWAGLWGGLAVLSHPEAAVHTAVSCLFLWLALSRTRRTFFYSLAVAGLVALVSAPWWATVLARHGIQTILAAAQTGQKWLAVLHLVFFSFTEEPYATVIAVLGLVGLIFQLTRRQFTLPLWLALPFFVEGRSAHLPAAIPLAMLASIALVDVIFPALRNASKKVVPDGTVSRSEQAVFFYLFLYLVFAAAQFSWQISTSTVYPGDRTAMQWVRENTPSDAKFLVLTGSPVISYDPVPEWFPELTGRRSLLTVQGLEWVSGEDFGDAVSNTAAVQTCLSVSAKCILDSESAQDFDYLYISRILHTENFGPLSPARTYPYAIEQLRANENLEVVYETEDVIIFRKK
jgi:hypothetical protein